MAVSKYPKDTITERCHWLAYTVPYYKDQLWPSFISASSKEIRPIAHFTNGLEISNGAKVFWNENRPQMGRHVIFSGQSCDLIGDNLKECLSFVHTNMYKPTRLDLAVDIFNTNLSLKHMQSLLKRREYKSHAQVAPHYEDLLGKGETVEIGRRGSAAFLRVYDKAAEQKIDESWLRVEISYGARKAKNALASYLQSNSVRGMVSDFVRFPTWRKWNYLLARNTVKVRYEIKQTNTRKWLLESVAKSIAKELLFDDGEQFRELLYARINTEYQLLCEKETYVDF